MPRRLVQFQPASFGDVLASWRGGAVALISGQWLGCYNGSNSGFLVVEIDDLGSHFEGIASAYDSDPQYPSSFVQVRTPDRRLPFRATVALKTIHPDTGMPVDWDLVRDRYPDILHPPETDITIDLVGDSLNVQWRTAIGTQGQAALGRSDATKESELIPRTDVTSWQDFKSFVGTLEHRRHIFRGQKHPHRLRTTFHRTGRACIPRYQDEDINTLHRYLCSRIPLFDFGNPDQYGAFFSLAQHHGYPTPLLDWTYSPYVAAFFAYRRYSNAEARNASPDKKVRIFIFNQHEWRQKIPQQAKLTWCKPHFSVMEFMALGNDRLVPQQSVFTITNVDDIETHIQAAAAKEKASFLEVADLPLNQRPVVMRELSVMGITAGSLFPGLDGMCEELKERSFDL